MRLATVLLGLLALPLAASAQTETYTSTLSGANEVPTPNASTATGSATVTVTTATRAFTVSGSYTGLTGTISGSHIHTGVAGANGPVIVGLTNTGGSTGTLSASGTFSEAQFSALKANGLYVNVHSTSFGGGEIRDQLRFLTPTVDGDCDDPNYALLGNYTQGHGFGNWGLKSFKSYRDATHLYVCVEGSTEGNFNGLYTWLDISDRATGTPVGTALATTGGGFESANPKLELPNTDYAFRIAHDGTTGYINVATYTGNGVVSNYLGSLATNGTASNETENGLFTGTTFAYRHKAGGLSTNTDGSGFEFKVELADIGASGTGTIKGEEETAAFASMVPSTFQLFTGYAGSDGGFFSSDVIPEVPGNGAANLGNDPDFPNLPGTQSTSSSSLPVELSSFTGVADGRSAVLSWTTESETDNAGFSVETLRGAAWNEVAFVGGRGTTSERASYERRIEGLTPGRHTFRLVQRDLDGTSTVAGNVEVEIAPEGAFAITERRVGSTVVLGLVAREMQDVTVDAFDVTGRLVARLFSGHVHGSSDVAFETAGLPSGVYLVRVTGERANATHSVVVAR